MVGRRTFIARASVGGFGLYLWGRTGVPKLLAQTIRGGTLDAAAIPKYTTPLVIPPAMPGTFGANVDVYRIAVRQFQQQILPAGLPPTTVWSYGSINHPATFNYPAFTIEASWNRPVQVQWRNELVAPNGDFLPHLLPVDQTLHWANPPGGMMHRDARPMPAATPDRYTGPVPIVTHLHGAAGVGDESDGFAEAWYLPNARNIPDGFATVGTAYEYFKAKARAQFGSRWTPGTATFQYANAQRASTLWYHDHTLGMTRVNVYAGPAGFCLLRGGPDDVVLDSRSGTPAVLPGPAPRENDPFPPNKTYYEIPIAIQDRSFNNDGSLFYPNTREFFDEIVSPYIPAEGGFSPIWNPEFFGNTMMVNGNTWPFHTVEQVRYRFRFLNGCQSRFLILNFSSIPGVEVWQIGNEGGFLAAPVNLTALGNQLLIGLAERADVIVDFTNVPVGNYVLGNVGPDEPFGGGVPGVDFDPSDAGSTGQVMQFRVVPAVAPDPTTPPRFLVLPAITPLPAATVTRPLALIEKMGEGFEADDEEVEGPLEALLGTVGPDIMDPATPAGVWTERLWMDPVTENPALGDTEVWEFYNTTGDAHPMHIHETVFEVVNREGLVLNTDGEVLQPIQLDGNITSAEPWESGFKDTVIAYPGQVTRVRLQFNTPGQFVWHCHIVEHEDNEMMRPYRIGPVQPGQPG